MSGAAIDGSAASKGTARCGGDGVYVVCVGIVEIVGAVDAMDVANRSVANVDVGNETVAGVKPGMVRLTETQREPTNAEADTESKAEAATEKSYEGRAINGIAAI
jgi:hypothetical protein